MRETRLCRNNIYIVYIYIKYIYKATYSFYTYNFCITKIYIKLSLNISFTYKT